MTPSLACKAPGSWEGKRAGDHHEHMCENRNICLVLLCILLSNFMEQVKRRTQGASDAIA